MIPLFKKSEAVLGLILLAFVLAISAAGWGYYKYQEQALREVTQNQLRAVANLKVSQIARWRQERLDDARLLWDSPLLHSRVLAFLSNPADPLARAQVLTAMQSFQRNSHFGRVVLLDAQVQPRLSIPPSETWIGARARQWGAAALRTNQVLISDLHRSEVSGRVNMDLFVPVRPAAPEPGSAVASGIFLLEVDPNEFLFPSLQSWPTPSRTAETLLVRREGDRVVFLNELRDQTNTSLKLSFSLAKNPQSPAARAVLGYSGVVAGRDYRQALVLAAVLPIPNSPWCVVAKQDQAEIYAPLRQQAWTISLIVGVLILAATLGVVLVWRNREYQFSLQEIEERKQAAAALEQSAQRWRGFTAAAFEGICVSEQGRILDANDQFLRLFGYDRAELLGREILSLAAPESRPAVAEAMRTGRENAYEHQALRKDGTAFVAEVQARMSVWEGRQVRVSALRDITEQKRTQEALQKRIVALTQPLETAAELHFNDLFDLEEIQEIQDALAKAAGVASVITRPDGVPLTRPSNFCRLCHSIIRQTELGRRNCFHSDAALGRHHPEGPIVQPCLSGGLWDAGASITVGGRHIANWLIGQVRNEAQDEAHLLAYAGQIGADPQEFRRALQEVPRMSREQFEQVARTVFLLANELSLRAYQNIQQARFIAERQRAEAERERLLHELVRKNKELESIVFVSSHDLRSPLVNIQGFSHRLKSACAELERLLQAPEVPPPVQAAAAPLLRERIGTSLNFILTSGLKMDALLTGLLRLSRLGRSALHFETLDMNRLAGLSRDALAYQFQQAGAALELGELPRCRGDATQISQVLTNLLDNALKYRAPERPLRLRLWGEVPDTHAVYCVEDNGRGIAPEHQEKIWDVFHRLDPSGAVKGEGLGLAIVRRILDRHEGRAWVESEPGRGSRFFFALPALPVENAPPFPP